MTTELKHSTPKPGVKVLLDAMVVAAVLGLLVALLGAVTDGAPAAYGALVGTLVIVFVLAFGAFSVELVSRVVPAMSIIVALLSYALQLVLLLVILVSLDRAGALEESLAPKWVVAAIIVGTFTWLVAQIVITTRLRLPVYDLSDPGAR
ncbi:MAG: hypothetical protein L0H93_15560 [Nocardioides sp.]|nr:hypothetical protein [Nocardioides sp.]